LIIKMSCGAGFTHSWRAFDPVIHRIERDNFRAPLDLVQTDFAAWIDIRQKDVRGRLVARAARLEFREDV